MQRIGIRSLCLFLATASAVLGCEDVPGATSDAAVGSDAADAPSSDAAIFDAPTADAASQGVITLASAQPAPIAIALDGGYVYWLSRGTYTNGNYNSDGAILRIPTSGGSPQVIVSGLAYPYRFAFSQGFVYWTTTGRPPPFETTGGVFRALISNGTVETLASGQVTPIAVAVDATNVYWTNAGDTNTSTPGNVMKRALVGGTAMQVAPGQTPAAIALDSTSLYWSDAADGTIHKMSLSPNSTPVTLATQQAYPLQIKLDATFLYVVNSGAQGFISRVPLDGSAQPQTISPQHYCNDMTVDSQHAYYTVELSPDGTVTRMGLDGSTPMVIDRERDGSGPIVGDDAYIYWIAGAGGGTGNILKLAK